jgi:rare lipoprotein A
MTRTTFIKTILLALLAASATGAAPVSAFAGTGGASAPSGSTPRPPGRVVALATWFGPGFYGQTTACGQTLTPAVVGVANRTLPCGTLVKVSYRGRRVIVPVIDRGPYGNNGADWDLTTEAAHALGMADTARIAARIVGIVPNTPTLGLPAESALAVAPASGASATAGGTAAVG